MSQDTVVLVVAAVGLIALFHASLYRVGLAILNRYFELRTRMFKDLHKATEDDNDK